jgi:hypothetical protein
MIEPMPLKVCRGCNASVGEEIDPMDWWPATNIALKGHENGGFSRHVAETSPEKPLLAIAISLRFSFLIFSYQA